MKFLRFSVIAAVFSLLIVSCIQEDPDQCITALDCFNGYLCVDGMCVPPENINGDKDSIKDEDQNAGDDDSVIDLDQIDDFITFPDEDESNENEDADADTAVDCDPGYHMEAEDDDENGDGETGCVKNVICTPDPCNGGVCTEKGMTVTCECSTGYAGRWCTECDSGYLKSTVDDKCKADCITGTYDCTGTRECAVDPIKNEAGCVCKEFFSGTGCTVCDAAHFCNSHGTCAASGANAVCTCFAAWSGDAACSTCTAGYIPDSGNCVEGCDDYCGSKMGAVTIGGTIYIIVADSNGKCEIKSGKAECVCDAGWESSLHYTIPGQIKPVCSDCDTSNPPVGGCPE